MILNGGEWFLNSGLRFFSQVQRRDSGGGGYRGGGVERPCEKETEVLELFW